MAKINVNLDEVKGGGEFAIIPEDKYSLRVTRASIKQGPSGHPNVYWICEVFDAELADINGKIVCVQTSLSPDALWKLKDFVDKGGYEWTASGFDTDDIIGMEVGADMIVDNYDGQDRMRADSFYKL